MITDQNVDTRQPIKEEINLSRKHLIEKINEIKNANLGNLNNESCPFGQPFEEIQHNLFVKYCVYLDSDTVRGFTSDKSRIGILLVTDFYISRQQAEKLKYKILTSYRILNKTRKNIFFKVKW